MAGRPPGFTKYTTDPAAGLPVGKWEPGLSAAPDDWLGPRLDIALEALGFDVDRPEDIRTGLLSAVWNGHPVSALVVATAAGRQPGEPFVVSAEPADPAA
ncbi:MAG: hypothetical protein JWO38_3241 [Gemmataceae bacterium]|nr:hypothetical protein [Gemmataceae bacterium]